MRLTSLFDSSNRMQEPSQRCLQFGGSMVSWLVQFYNSSKQKENEKLAFASNISTFFLIGQTCNYSLWLPVYLADVIFT